jgi:hypothetical protein
MKQSEFRFWVLAAYQTSEVLIGRWVFAVVKGSWQAEPGRKVFSFLIADYTLRTYEVNTG